jgi:hypothetical protein
MTGQLLIAGRGTENNDLRITGENAESPVVAANHFWNWASSSGSKSRNSGLLE